MPGVLAVYAGADLAGYGSLKCVPPLKNRDGTPMKKPPRPALAVDKVRFVGDPVACVVAQTAIEAKEAAEAVALDIEPLPAVTLASEAVKPGAPLVFDDVPNNVALDYHYGDAEKVNEALAGASSPTAMDATTRRSPSLHSMPMATSWRSASPAPAIWALISARSRHCRRPSMPSRTWSASTARR